ncbi:MAG: hypothetical protein M5U28_18390 [Sandaracinaceae bacterium]|nr:hypothetical protein [Sandaracinaceae bacterium]
MPDPSPAGEPTSSRRATSRLPTVALAAAVSYFVLCAAATALVQGLLWDLRAYHRDPIDSTWRVELAWRAWHGEWAGIDFHYPRGPLWQVFGWTAATLADGEVPWTLALLGLGFHLATLGVLLALVLRAVPHPWWRVAAFVACALLSNTSGIETFRGALPLLVLFALVPRELGADPEPRPWRGALAAGAVTALATLVSFDRLYAIGVCTMAALGFELLARLRHGLAPRHAVLRALRYGAACAACFAVTLLLLGVLGGDPVEAIEAQRSIGASYASNMSTEWRVDVPRANVTGLFAGCLALAAGTLLAPRGGRGMAAGVWLTGALPAVTFAFMRADEGHMIISMTPALVVLFFVAAGASAGAPMLARWSAGVLATMAVVGWFGTYPGNMAGHPGALADATLALRGEKGPDHAFRTDVRYATEWAAAELARTDGCLAVSAPITILHPLLDARGPTELGLRWDETIQRALAERLERARCPIFVYAVVNYDESGESWPFGPDFVTVARTYRPVRQLGPATLGMRRRSSPRAVTREPMAEPDATARTVGVPGELRVPLTGAVRGTDLVELELSLDFPRWRALAGGAPLVEWRFENEGEGVSPWRQLFHLGVGEPVRTQVSVDPEAAEWFWIASHEPSIERAADALALRVSPRGVASPAEVSLRVHGVTRLSIEPDPVPPPTRCDSSIDLLERVHRSQGALVRHASPDPGPYHFNLDPSPPNARLAEVLFPMVPCEDGCLSAKFSVQADPSESDGAVAEVHVLDYPARSLLRQLHVPPGGEEHPLEVWLGAWAGRRVFLRIGTLAGGSHGNDYVKVVVPRVGPCSARGELAEALLAERATAVRGAPEVRGATSSSRPTVWRCGCRSPPSRRPARASRCAPSSRAAR